MRLIFEAFVNVIDDSSTTLVIVVDSKVSSFVDAAAVVAEFDAPSAATADVVDDILFNFFCSFFSNFFSFLSFFFRLDGESDSLDCLCDFSLSFKNNQIF